MRRFLQILIQMRMSAIAVKRNKLTDEIVGLNKEVMFYEAETNRWIAEMEGHAQDLKRKLGV